VFYEGDINLKIVGAEECLKQSALEKIEHLKNLYKDVKNEELDIEIEVQVESKRPFCRNHKFL
jgi:tRNA A37 threonylcarbamoyladenosine biosynthesis protein TsaE